MLQIFNYVCEIKKTPFVGTWKYRLDKVLKIIIWINALLKDKSGGWQCFMNHPVYI